MLYTLVDCTLCKLFYLLATIFPFKRSESTAKSLLCNLKKNLKLYILKNKDKSENFSGIGDALTNRFLGQIRSQAILLCSGSLGVSTAEWEIFRLSYYQSKTLAKKHYSYSLALWLRNQEDWQRDKREVI